MKILKHCYIILVVFVFTCNKINAQTCGGRVYESLKINSTILSSEINYSLYLPPDYETSERSYPVLYLLHGYGDNYTSWVQYGEIKAIVDKAISQGMAAPMIIVMPDGGKSWYINDYKGEHRYEDFFIKEFIPSIEAKYRCRGSKEFRAVAGLSMGGYGSLIYAIKHANLFSACCPLSPAVFTDDEIMAMDAENYRFNYLYGGGKEKERLTEHWKKNSVLNIIKNIPENHKKAVRFYIDCGDDDFLYKGNAALHVTMRDAKIPHEFRMRDGTHNWEYWRTALPGVLEFITRSFHR